MSRPQAIMRATTALPSAGETAATTPNLDVPPPDATTGDTSLTASVIDVVGGVTDTFDATVVNQGIEGGTFPGGTGDSASLDAGLGSGGLDNGVALEVSGGAPSDPHIRR
ncbi:MAG: hypothetical protein ACYCW6_29000 [Candidatus Xenobia bacterium]